MSEGDSVKRIAVVTGTRADYGLLKQTLRKLEADSDFELQLIVTGSHLSNKFGYTKDLIINDGFKISAEIHMLLDSSDETSISKSMAIEMMQLSEIFKQLKPHMLLILGDRYEIFAAVSVAMTMKIPIAHMCGGESTEGAIDEQIRHAITKMSHIHFTTTEFYRECVIKMGEDKNMVFNVGSPGVENILKMNLLSREEIFNELGISDNKRPIFLVTYHPVTIETYDLKDQIINLINAIDDFDANIIITYPNADFGNEIIVKELENFQIKNDCVKLFKNLGELRYLSAMKYCDVIIGNSSSGITEAAVFKKPVINIGNRQKGRIKSSNIIDAGYSIEEIYDGIYMALNDEKFKESLSLTENLHGNGETSDKIINILKSIDFDSMTINKRLNYINVDSSF